jgi:hypothetical protein
MDTVDRAIRWLVAVEGVDGRPLIETEGVDPVDADAWMEDLMKLIQSIPVWRATHIGRHGAGERVAPSDWTDATPHDSPPDDEEDAEHDGWEDDE